MDKSEIAEIIEHIKQTQTIRTNKTHPWVTEDGPYDYMGHRVRLFIYDGFSYLIANDAWVSDPVANLRLPEWMRKPWGTYPDLPPKPPKAK